MANGALKQIAMDPQVQPILKQVPSGARGPLLAAFAGAADRHAKRVLGGSMPGPKMHTRERRLRGSGMERYRLWNTYYSVVRFQAAVAVSAPTTTLTLLAGTELRPFSYKIGDSLVTAAGFDATFGGATEADTNLVKAGETVAGELVKVHGMSLMPSGISDIELWKQIEANLSVAITMNGDAQRYRLGRMSMIPGGGGTHGAGPTTAIAPALAASIDNSYGWSNGWPDIANFFPFPEPMIWSPSGETDSNFSVVLKLQRALTLVEVARAAASGVAAFAPPTAAGQFGSFVDVMCRLHAEQMAPRSVNQ